MSTPKLPRSAWTDTASRAPAQLVASRVAGIAVHWDGDPVPANVYAGDEKAVAAFLEGIRRFHVNGRGWSDIAYQWAVDTAGRRWHLRGWLNQSAANGDVGPNQRYGAVVALLGTGQKVTPQLVDGLRDAIADFRDTYPHATKVVTHNDVRPEPTACPGPELTRLVHGGRLNPDYQPNGDDMPTPADIAKAVLAGQLRSLTDGTVRTLGQLVTYTHKHAADAHAGVDVLREQLRVVAEHVDIEPAELDAIEARVRGALADAVVNVDVNVAGKPT